MHSIAEIVNGMNAAGAKEKGMKENVNHGAMTWMVRRVEANGESTQTVEMSEESAASLYANWCSNAKRFNDQKIELVRVIRMQTIVSQKTNTEHKSPLAVACGEGA